MNPIVAFILGLLIGWLIEWVIDWIFWRRKTGSRPIDEDVRSRTRVVELEQELASYKNQLESLQTELTRTDPPVRTKVADEPVITSQAMAAPVQVRDPLYEIQGITPAMADHLNQAGIYTFSDLSGVKPLKLREMFGDQLPEPGSEVELIKQARRIAGTINQVDDLEVIVGIGPVISRMLNASGIFTFAELAALSVSDLREIVGDRIQRIADEEQILSQARQLAEAQNRGG